LHQRRAGGDFLPGIRRVKNAAHADDRQRAACLAIQMAHDFRAALPQGPPAQSAGLRINLPQFRVPGFRAGDGGVGGDDARDPPRLCQFQDFIQRLEKQGPGATLTRMGRKLRIADCGLLGP
jgi:hypothetical protein